MDWLVGFLLLVVGGIIGFYVAKYVNREDKSQSDSTANEQTVKELMLQQASNHLNEARQISEQLTAHSDALKKQIEDYEQLLITQNTSPGEESSLHYFGEHASTYLRNKSKTPQRTKDSADIQPLDFASQGSGLFSGSEDTMTKETK